VPVRHHTFHGFLKGFGECQEIIGFTKKLFGFGTEGKVLVLIKSGRLGGVFKI
jgi:hypothetical protein